MIEIKGFLLLRGALSPADQRGLLDAVRAVVAQAPLVRPVTRWAKPMSVRMTSAGRWGWTSDRSGYRYVARHPRTGEAWPSIPEAALAIWRAASGYDRAPDSCLINFYGEDARMGLHRDSDEGDMDAPVVSVSLGDPAVFRVGGTERREPTASFVLESGDVVVIGGPRASASRLAFHGVDRIRFGGGRLLPDGGRINLTLRVVAPRPPT